MPHVIPQKPTRNRSSFRPFGAHPSLRSISYRIRSFRPFGAHPSLDQTRCDATQRDAMRSRSDQIRSYLILSYRRDAMRSTHPNASKLRALSHQMSDPSNGANTSGVKHWASFAWTMETRGGRRIADVHHRPFTCVLALHLHYRGP